MGNLTALAGLANYLHVNFSTSNGGPSVWTSFWLFKDVAPADVYFTCHKGCRVHDSKTAYVKWKTSVVSIICV